MMRRLWCKIVGHVPIIVERSWLQFLGDDEDERNALVSRIRLRCERCGKPL